MGVAAGQHPVVRHGDCLNRDPAAGHHEPIESLEVRGPEPVSDRLDHFDRQHSVVAAFDVAVVAQVDLDPVGQSGLGHPLTGQSLLLRGQRDRTDVCAPRRGADAQFAPAGADLEHSAARPDARGIEEPVDLSALCVGESVTRRRAGLSNSALEYVIVSSRNSANRALDRS